MNARSVVFGQLVQKFEQIPQNSSTLQDDQNEWSQCRYLDSRVKSWGFHKIALSRPRTNSQAEDRLMHSARIRNEFKMSQ